MKSYMSIPGIPDQSKMIDLTAARIWEIDPDKLRIRTRKREVAEARMVCMNYRHTVLKMTLAKSSEPYDLNHDMTVYEINKIKDLLEVDKQFAIKYEQFMKQVV